MAVNKFKLEIGCGQSPECINDWWIHNDINAFPHVEHVCKASEIPLEPGSCDYITLNGVFEHFTYKEAEKVIRKCWEWLCDGGMIHFKHIPDSLSYVQSYLNKEPGFPGVIYGADLDPKVFKTLEPNLACVVRAVYGWQRWEGDEHKSYWNEDIIHSYFDEYFDITIEKENIVTNHGKMTALHYHVRGTKKAIK